MLVNSLYSFWWDVTNDWGLWMLLPSTWSRGLPSATSAPPSREQSGSPRSSVRHSYPNPHLRRASLPTRMLASISNGTSPESRTKPLEPIHTPRERSPASSIAPASGLVSALLRPTRLLPDSSVYFLAVAIDLLLRLTWSLKLSSHLHSIHELEQGVFLLEALEVIRRWIWVFFRVEFEQLKRNPHDHDEDDEMPLIERSAADKL